MAKLMKTMDGNTAAAWASYAFTEVAGIFPITPSSPMAEVTDEWAAEGKKNIFGQTVKVSELQSEAGAAGTVHGSLVAGALTTTYTASQGLLLMIPNMYKIAGELLPSVFHVSARAVATHALSIFGDHSDVMACRQTGFAMLASNSVQEVMDLGAVAHLATLKGEVPFIHFFDGFRTSHEVQKIECLDYEDLANIVDKDAIDKFRKRALNPEHPTLKGTAQNPDIFFQAKEAANKFYDALPSVVEEYMGKINELTGRDYQLFNYYGADDAEYVIIAMGSVCEAAEEVIDHLTAQGEKVGMVKVHLFRPFSVDHFIKAIPSTCKKIAVLDRTKEPGSLGEPLYQDICTAFFGKANAPQIVGGRYGLGSKDVTPGQIVAVYDNLKSNEPKNKFTIGINDDVTHLSLEAKEVDVADKDTTSCKFWGLGADGTVGANKNSIKIIGDHTDMYAQAYFSYDSKKSGGVTQSHLRFGKKPIRSTYYVKSADFIACHNQAYVHLYDMLSEIKDGGTFLLNTVWSMEELDKNLPANVKRTIAEKNIKFYIINATAVAKELGLGNRTNTVLQAAFFKLANIIPIEDAVKYMKEAIQRSYGKKGDAIVKMNNDAVDQGLDKAIPVEVPAEWKDSKSVDAVEQKNDVPEFIAKVVIPVNAMKGDDLPVSTFSGREDGTFPQGTAAYEKRGVANMVPEWNAENCIQCNQCSYVCPHATIRPFLLNDEEAKNAPVEFGAVAGKGKGVDQYQYKMQVSPLDCQGCSVCVTACPAKTKALTMVPIGTQEKEIDNWEYAVGVSAKENPAKIDTVKGSQFEQPLLEFSGACAGCGETPYAKLITQLFGDRMYISNATGCSSIWGGSAPSMPYTTNHKGQGPAWGNSLFEDNAEFGYGMYLGVKQIREGLEAKVKAAMDMDIPADAKDALGAWVDTMYLGDESKETSAKLLEVAKAYDGSNAKAKEIFAEIVRDSDHLVKKSQWIFGGDGWAYDIGYGGLDHVLASGEDVNIFVFDTEVYSNTGGQSSKSTPVGAVAKFAASGKRVKKKDLGMMAMSYGYVYVAQIAMGANQAQTIKAIKEAEAYPGPSLIIAYATCINHGIKGGMAGSQSRMKKAVECGYWHLYRFNPQLAQDGKNPFVLDSKEPTGNFRDFIMEEVRYSSLSRSFPDVADELFVKTEADAKERLEIYQKKAQ